MTSVDSKYFKLIKAKRIIDGKGGPPLERGALLLEGDRIKAVGSEESVVAPEGAKVEEYDYGDKTVLPGLVDAHVHMIGIGDGRAGDELATLPDEVLTLQAGKNARAHLYSGVTAVVDCGAKHNTTVMLRQAVGMGILPSPRLVLSIRPIAIIGGHLNYFGTTATGADECRAAVRQLVKEGADFIKVTATGGSTRTSFPYRPSFELDELRAICDETHKFGKHVMAHVVCSAALERCLDAGVDTIAHCCMLKSDGSYVYRPDIANRLAKQHVYVNPTLHQGRERIWQVEKKKEAEGLTDAEQAQLDSDRKSWDVGVDQSTRMRADGVTLIAGSDSAWLTYRMGGFQGEIEAMMHTGMSNMEAIVSATYIAARSCFKDSIIGSLEPGKMADVLVVDGDPLKDIWALNNVVDVFHDGVKVDRRNLV